MRKTLLPWPVLVALFLVWPGLLLSAAAMAQITLKDDRGVSVSLPAPPQRIVSLVPALSESLCVLGACARIVATDRYSNYPSALLRTPKVGEIISPDIDAIVALKPDLVLIGYVPRVAERLQARGLKVLLLEQRNQRDVQRALGILGRLLGLRDPDAAWREIDARIARAAQSVPAAARGLSFYYEFESSLYAASEASFIGESLARLGARNVVPARLGLFPRLSPEYVPRADPQVIMVARRDALSLPKRAGWGQIRAVREQRICWLQDDEADVLARPGPRLGEAAEILARCLRAAASGPIAPPPRQMPLAAAWP
ncbi:ABC transporter substrate-binding protein [Rhodocyclus tenuis]|uniref:Iron complex transport system substrate-binding protein n=1 Tax=Rhodocyclus tenuis TaxID=1066 RepID=A0A840GEK7_RHOTE|nr:helical backbone metal receptor [Rhodocyclus tenuis]MBB4249068.1 iron complex transport system substrate-binding protein [Rhodocyclus tenuis]